MTDQTLLTWIHRGQTIATLLVAVGVAGEFLGDWVARPIEDRIESARQLELAQLRQRAEEDRLARVKIEERLSPRRSSEAQRNTLTEKLSGLKGRTLELSSYSDPETQQFASELEVAIKAAGVNVQSMPFLQFGAVEKGLSLEIGAGSESAAASLAEALIAAELAEKPMQGKKIDRANALVLHIGPKP